VSTDMNTELSEYEAWLLIIWPWPSMSMGFIWVLELTAIISSKGINQMVFVMACLLWATDWILKYYIGELFELELQIVNM
jgi:hypothetical protein